MDALAAQRGVVVDEADGAIGLGAVVLQLPGQQLTRIAGADDEDALALRLVQWRVKPPAFQRRGSMRAMPWKRKMKAALITFTVSGIGRLGSRTLTVRMPAVTMPTAMASSRASRTLPYCQAVR